MPEVMPDLAALVGPRQEHRSPDDARRDALDAPPPGLPMQQPCRAVRCPLHQGHARASANRGEGRKRLTLESSPRRSVLSMGSTAVTERGLRVGELAEAVGATSDTIRYYERAGLLPPPRRTPAGYRAYDELAVDRLRFIQGAQRLGLRLADIRDLLSVRDTGSCACGPAEDLLGQRVAEVDAEIARLGALRHEMLAMLHGLAHAGCPSPAPGTWCPPSEGEVKPMALDLIDTCCEDCPPEACSSGCC
jgi:DNA-binding transcriptional MerR regulator